MLEAAASYKSHEVSCNNTQIGVLRLQGRQHKDGGTVVFCRMAAVGDQVMLMYPCEVDCMGKEEEYLVECPSLACHAGSFEAFTEPERWVRVPEMPEVTMYAAVAVMGTTGHGCTQSSSSAGGSLRAQHGRKRRVRSPDVGARQDR